MATKKKNDALKSIEIGKNTEKKEIEDQIKSVFIKPSENVGTDKMSQILEADKTKSEIHKDKIRKIINSEIKVDHVELVKAKDSCSWTWVNKNETKLKEAQEQETLIREAIEKQKAEDLKTKKEEYMKKRLVLMEKMMNYKPDN